MADQELQYRVRRRGSGWHWEVLSNSELLQSGVEPTSAAARVAAFEYIHGRAAQDIEGQEFTDDDAARHEAVQVARNLARNRTPSADERVIVTNAQGVVIHEEPVISE